VPDFTNSKLSGNLSKKKYKVLNIGPLSRFENYQKKDSKILFKYLAIISGPEPHRSLLEKEVMKCFLKTKYKCAIINGKTRGDEKITENITVFPHLESKEFTKLISKSEFIICRSGYSSIMDLYFLQKKVIFIPTPGQTEQEYLAKYYKEKYAIQFFKQGKLDLKECHFNSIKKNSNPKKKLLEVALKKINL
jgi:UDP-N-acetylglucosamine transferase subunit ALG13